MAHPLASLSSLNRPEVTQILGIWWDPKAHFLIKPFQNPRLNPV